LRVGFLPMDLARWDQGRPADLLAIGLWSDVRPLRGAAGLLDWRLCGKLSTLIVAGKVNGAADEQTLMPGAHRLIWKLVLAVGLGPRAEFSEPKFSRVIRRILKTMSGLKLGSLALALPGREDNRITAARAFALLMKESREVLPEALDDLTLIEPPVAQKEMAELLRQQRGGARS
jgi:hypothetical protein